MIVKIDRKEVDIIKETCALANCSCNFFSTESNPLMVQVEILEHNGDELSAKDAWMIGRSVVWKITTEEIKHF